MFLEDGAYQRLPSRREGVGLGWVSHWTVGGRGLSVPGMAISTLFLIHVGSEDVTISS
jgi:hypothetical protein